MSDNGFKIHSMYEAIERETVQNPSRFFLNQLISAKDILKAYFEESRYVILTAEMQSGKTDTFYLVAFEMLRNEIVRNVYIICGSGDTELRGQHRLDDPDIEKLYNKYHLYLNVLGWSTEEILRIIADIKKSIVPVFGTQLKKVEYEARDVLIIHDESHFAQSEGNMVDLSLRSTGIHLDGQVEQLMNRNYYYLSVSATPCSELSNNMLMGQGKRIVVMMPGEGYMSIEEIYLTGRIHGFNEWQEGLAEGLRKALEPMRSSGQTGYAIVRVQNNKEADARYVCQQYGCDFLVYDGNRSKNSLTINQILSKKTERLTVIFVKGLLRMGKRLYKKYLRFCLESAKGSKTDTLMQSLLGRCCGYDSLDTIQFYVDQDFLDSGELERYIAMAKGQPVIPFKAMNLAKGTGRETRSAKPLKCGLYPIVPLVLPVFFTNSPDRNLKERIVQEIKSNYEVLLSGNGPEQNAAIRDLLVHKLDTDNFHLRRLDGTKYKAAYKSIPKAIRENKARKLGESSGVNENEAILWYVEADGLEDMTRGHVYISCLIGIGAPAQVIIPSTTGKEIFK